jgi:tetratricopeptide (TPR) repeat protein
MNKIFNKIIPILVSLMIFDSAHAMKIVLSDDAPQNDIAVELPTDVITYMLSKLPLEDLSVSFVNKQWLGASKQAFPEFYEFQSTYHACRATYKKDKNVSNILKKLRNAEKNIGTPKNKERLVRAFLVRNFDSINQTTKTDEWLLQIGFDKYPERLLQMALLRIWDTIPPVAKSPLQSYNIPSLKLLAPNDLLTGFFRQEDHFATKCDLASELCERGQSNEVASEANKAVLKLKIVEGAALYEIVISKEPNNITGIDYASAGYANSMLNNHKRAAELYEIAISKEPNNITGIDYGNAASTSLMLKNYKRAAELYEMALSKESNPNNITVRIYAGAGYANIRLKNYKRAAELYEIALSKEPNPNNISAIDYLEAALANLMLNDYERAVELYEIALSKKTCKPLSSNHKNAAIANLMCENWERSIQYGLMSLEQAPNNARVLFNLGFAYAKLEKIEEAAGHFKKFIDLPNASVIQLDQENDTEHTVSLLQIMEIGFSKTSNEACLEWVHKEQQNIKNTNLSGM